MDVLAPVRRQWWLRTLLVSGVLAGVLGMHGLTTGHAAMQMAPSASTTAAVGAHAPLASGVPMTADRAVPAHPTYEGHGPTGGHGAMVACLAILVAAVALLVLLLGRERPGRPLLQSAVSSPADGRPPPTPPRVLALTLHQLSICRT